LSERISSRSLRTLAIAGTTAVAAMLLAASSPVGPWDSERGGEVTVIYIGADDCAPCRAWRRDHWPKFRASPEFTRLNYREVTSPKLFDLLQDNYWPEDLRGHRNALDRTAGVPLWFVVRNDKVALQARGLRQWEEVALPRIRLLVR